MGLLIVLQSDISHGNHIPMLTLICDISMAKVKSWKSCDETFIKELVSNYAQYLQSYWKLIYNRFSKTWSNAIWFSSTCVSFSFSVKLELWKFDLLKCRTESYNEILSFWSTKCSLDCPSKSISSFSLGFQIEFCIKFQTESHTRSL